MRIFQCGEQDRCTSATFCGYSNTAELARVNRSTTMKIGIQTGTMTVPLELSSSVLMNWDFDYPINKFKTPKDYKLEAVDTDKKSGC